VTNFAETLRQWHDFFLLTGGAAATLMGLVFVAVSIAAARPRVGTTPEARETFATPIVLHFGRVLTITSVCLVPMHSAASLGVLLLAIGVVNTLYMFFILRGMIGHDAPIDAGHWMWHFVAPFVSSVLIVAAGAGFYYDVPRAPIGLALCVVLLLATGIRNSWRLMLWFLEQPV
jgi:hypothetical protein